MKLSLCIATYNEEANIHYPLDSCYDFVDEVIIVDGGSADKTVEKAKSYGKKVKVFIEPNPPMFHLNKQKAIERAKGEWILQLDADEEIADELKLEIKEIIHRNFQFPISPSTSSGSRTKSRDNFQSNTKFQNSNVSSRQARTIKNYSSSERNESRSYVAYYLPRKNFFLTRFLLKGGQYPDYTIRLYRNGAVRFPLKSVHENVVINPEFKIQNSELIGNWELEIGYLSSPILHYADPDFSRYLKRWDRYTTLDAGMLAKEIKYQISNIKYLLMFLDYFMLKPTATFFSMYFRHLGFMDGFPGFVFALFSSIRFWVIYIKLPTLSKSSRFLTKLYQTMSLRGGGTTTKQSH